MRLLPSQDLAFEATPQDGRRSRHSAAPPQHQLSQQQLVDSLGGCRDSRHAAIGLQLFVQQNDFFVIKSIICVG
jgi:hypothetical protein